MGPGKLHEFKESKEQEIELLDLPDVKEDGVKTVGAKCVLRQVFHA